MHKHDLSVDELLHETREQVPLVIEDHDLLIRPDMIQIGVMEDAGHYGGYCMSIGATNHVINMAYGLYQNRSLEHYLGVLEHEISHAESVFRFGIPEDPHGDQWQRVADEMNVSRYCVVYRVQPYMAVCTGCDYYYAYPDPDRCDDRAHESPCPICTREMRLIKNDPDATTRF